MVAKRIRVSYKGKTDLLKNFAKEYGLPYHTLYYRWKALDRPQRLTDQALRPSGTGIIYTIKQTGQRLGVTAMASKYGVNRSTLSRHLRRQVAAVVDEALLKDLGGRTPPKKPQSEWEKLSKDSNTGAAVDPEYGGTNGFRKASLSGSSCVLSRRVGTAALFSVDK